MFQLEKLLAYIKINTKLIRQHTQKIKLLFLSIWHQYRVDSNFVVVVLHWICSYVIRHVSHTHTAHSTCMDGELVQRQHAHSKCHGIWVPIVGHSGYTRCMCAGRWPNLTFLATTHRSAGPLLWAICLSACESIRKVFDSVFYNSSETEKPGIAPPKWLFES